MTKAGYDQWLVEPPLSGWLAVSGGLVAIAVPTLIRAAAGGVITGCEFTPYLPFVLLSAVLLRWWQAGLVALASIAIMGGLLMGSAPGHLLSACFLSSAAMFLAGSAAMIGTVLLMRRSVATALSRRDDRARGDIVFSLEKDQVWASWYHAGPPVLLGPEKQVGPMMKDFLAQVELGKRLGGK